VLVVAGAEVRPTLKLEPSLAITDGTASAWLVAFNIVIGCAPRLSKVDRLAVLRS